ncbi:MAG: GAF and ANTAR domain-containing protein, partial [Mycobacteriales bacterium]
DGKAYTAAYTSQRARELDESQYRGEHGPCMDVAQSTGRMLVRDMSCEPRWPIFCAAATAAGVASSLSLSLPIQQALVGALYIYGEVTDAFSEDDVELAVTFAAHTAVAVANAHLYDAASTLAENMKLAMESRATIEQAKGIVMAREQVDAETAFAMLSAVSQKTNRKLRDIALELIAQATKPSD